MPNLSFNVTVAVENRAMLPEMTARMRDLSPAFEAVANEWAELNEQKFEQSVGSEASGASVFGEPWMALTPGYMKAKHSEGSSRVTRRMKSGKAQARFEGAFPDWLMVRTGALREALIDPEAQFRQIEPTSAYFGTPTDSALADRVRWNFKKRPTIFLSAPDIQMIKRILQDYFSLGGNFQAIRSQQGMEAIGYAPVDALGMETDFEEPGI